MKRLTPYLIFVLAVGGLVVFIYKDQIFPSTATDEAGASANSQAGGRRGGGGAGNYRRRDQIVPVLAEKVKTDNVPVYLNGVGTVNAYNTATVRTQVSGRLTSVPYQEGQDVKIGDVLAQIDPVLYQAAYDQAVAQKAKDEAILANARLDLARYTNLVKSNAATQQQADTAVWAVKQDEAQVKLDQALVDNAKANLDYATIKAPLTGRTGIRLVDTGNLVSSSDATGIVIITQLQPIAVIFTLPENTVADVIEAQTKGPVQLQAVTGAKAIGEGTLLVVDNQVDQTTGTYRIKGTFQNEKNHLWPGQFVNIKLKLKILENAMVIPSVAVQQGANGSYVYLVTPENTAKIAYVTVVQEGENRTVISKGAAPGDLIVTSGFAGLQDGSKVRVDTQLGGGPSASVSPAEAPPAGKSNGDQPQGRRKEASADEGAIAADDQPQQQQRRHRRQGQSNRAGGVEAAPAARDAPKQ
jgi:membrane fusion protein, multidrug efflux system